MRAEPHWRLQTQLGGLEFVKYDMIIQLEQLNLAELYDKLKIPAEYRTIKIINTTTCQTDNTDILVGNYKHTKLLSKACLENQDISIMIHNKYKADYLKCGY